MSDDTLTDGDYILIRLMPNGRHVILRTKKLSQIRSSSDWDDGIGKTDDGSRLVFQEGPDFLPEMSNARVVQASGGHSSTLFLYVGDPSSSKGLWRWTSGAPTWQRVVPATDGSARMARRFFVDPYNASRIYIIDETAIKRSESAGITWQLDDSLDKAATENKTFSYEVLGLGTVGQTAVIRDMIFDRLERRTRFVVGNAGVFFTRDGENWTRLLSTTATPGYPVTAYFDPISDPLNRSLYVAISGRGILRINPIPRP